MKIIGGKAKGRKLRSQVSGLRPLSNQAREALFNILREEICDSTFLDLFAGTGSVGIEALSRGANLSVFVEKNRRAVNIIRENLELTGFDEFGEVYCMDVRAVLRHFKKKGAKFDIVFIGAPYDSPVLPEILNELSGGFILSSEGRVVAEHRKNLDLPDIVGSLKKIKDYKYGDTMLSCYKI